MQSLKCSLILVIALGLCHMCMAMPGRYLRAADDENLVTLQFEDNEQDLNPINAVIARKRFKRSDGGKGKAYPADTPEFDRSNVSLDFPDELFTKSFATLTNVSKSISRFIMNSARRYARFVLFFKPVFGDALVVQGFENPTTTTTTTTTTTAGPNDTLNEI